MQYGFAVHRRPGLYQRTFSILNISPLGKNIPLKRAAVADKSNTVKIAHILVPSKRQLSIFLLRMLSA